MGKVFIKKIYFLVLLLLLAALSNTGNAQIMIGKENDSSWMGKELPSETLARKKFTLKRKLIQNMLTRFNSYYNARIKLEETVEQATREHQDNYDSLLTLFPYTAESFNSLKGNLDSVIFDASYGINIHDPRSKWMDNLYLIAGKAYYYEHDYPNAIEAFQYIIQEKGKKKEGTTPEAIGSRGYTSREQISVATPEKKKLFYHRPSRNDAFIWLIRSYIDSGAYDLAASLINTLQADPVFPKRLAAGLLTMQSKFYFNQQEIDKGITALEKAAAGENDHALKARWNFILGQYFQEQKAWEKAISHYNSSLRISPSPLMRFYARLNTITVHMQEDSSNYSSGMNDLLTMARKEKYELYRSIIYYHLAQNALLNKHPDEAVSYLEKGLLYNNDNGQQKIKNYYMLAHLLYSFGKYEGAKQYYDSTLAFIDPSFAHYDEVVLRQSALGDLVVQRNIANRQDSLQHLASLPSAELEAFLNQIVADSTRARKKRNLFISGPTTRRNDLSDAEEGLNPASDQQSADKSQTWYFYNNALKAKGFSLFKSTWGKRALADNWRISTSSSANPTPNKTQTVPGSDSLLAAGKHHGDSSNTALQQLMAPIPLTAAGMKISNDSIMLALYNEAVILSDRLDNDTAALNTLNELIARYPENPYLAATYYRLYMIYAKLGNKPQAGHYKQLLSEKYSTSKYNAALTNPRPGGETYAQKTTTQLYENAYLAYLNGNYAQVKTLNDSAAVVDPDNAQKARFDLLSAMAVIKQYPEKDTGKNLLQQVINKDKNDSAIANQAKNILNALDHKQELIEHLAHLQLPASPEDTLSKNTEVQGQLRPDTVQAQKPVAAHPANAPAPSKDTLAAVKPAVPAPPPPTPYKVNAKDSYFVVLAFNHTDTKVINDCQEKFAVYNEKNHAGEGIEVSTYLINQKVILIFRLFGGELPALKYYNEIKKNAASQIIPGIPANYYDLFIISRDNFILLNSSKDFSGYMKFFSENYR